MQFLHGADCKGRGPYPATGNRQTQIVRLLRVRMLVAVIGVLTVLFVPIPGLGLATGFDIFSFRRDHAADVARISFRIDSGQFIVCLVRRDRVGSGHCGIS